MQWAHKVFGHLLILTVKLGWTHMCVMNYTCVNLSSWLKVISKWLRIAKLVLRKWRSIYTDIFNLI